MELFLKITCSTVYEIKALAPTGITFLSQILIFFIYPYTNQFIAVSSALQNFRNLNNALKE